jgi:hypothetical protein
VRRKRTQWQIDKRRRNRSSKKKSYEN